MQFFWIYIYICLSFFGYLLYLAGFVITSGQSMKKQVDSKKSKSLAVFYRKLLAFRVWHSWLFVQILCKLVHFLPCNWMPTTHTCLPHIPDSRQPSGLLGYASFISMAKALYFEHYNGVNSIFNFPTITYFKISLLPKISRGNQVLVAKKTEMCVCMWHRGFAYFSLHHNDLS